MKIWGVAVAAALLSACATTAPVSLATTFDPAEVQWAQSTGNNKVNGNAVMRTVGGEVRTCAGAEAWLTPMGTYARERVTAIYGSPEGGLGRRDISFSQNDPRYYETSRKTVCDSQGNFEFNDVPDGEYYAIALVQWGVPVGYGVVNSQGGWIAQRIQLKGGEQKRVILSH